MPENPELQQMIREDWALIGPTPFSLVDRCPKVRDRERKLREWGDAFSEKKDSLAARRAWDHVRVLHDLATVVHRDVTAGKMHAIGAVVMWSEQLCDDLERGNPDSIVSWVPAEATPSHRRGLQKTLRVLAFEYVEGVAALKPKSGPQAAFEVVQ